MADQVDPLLERIDRDLVECDASTMPELVVDEPAKVVEYVGFDVEPQPERMRGWLARWISRIGGGR